MQADVSTDTGLDESDYVQYLFDCLNLKVLSWVSTPTDREWLETYGLYADLLKYLGSEAMWEAWQLAKEGHPDWAELLAFGKERDRRKELRPATIERRKRYRRKPEVMERERSRAKARRVAAREARAS